MDVGVEPHRHAGRLAAAARTADGLPVGVMLAGRPAEEALLLSLVRAGRGGGAVDGPHPAGLVEDEPDDRPPLHPVRNPGASRAFYDAVLGTLGGGRVLDFGDVVGYAVIARTAASI